MILHGSCGLCTFLTHLALPKHTKKPKLDFRHKKMGFGDKELGTTLFENFLDFI
jgi:hypothetical protein